MSKLIRNLFSLLLILTVSFSLVAQDDGSSSGSSSSDGEEPLKGTFDLVDEEGKENSGDVSGLQADPSKEYSTADMPEDNYLARFHALKKISALEKENIEKIYMLNIIQENFNGDKGVKIEVEKSENGDGSLKGEYDQVYEGYKKAMDLYYRRHLVYAAVKLEENKKHINQLYEKISDQYRADTFELLNLCANEILELSLDAKSASNPNRNKKLFNQMTRLRVAYGQMDDAEEMRVKRQYQTSIFHYRIAKAYAIEILEDINPKAYIGQEGNKKQFDVHKADNKNRIFSGETTATDITDKEKDIEKENTDNTQEEAY